MFNQAISILLLVVFFTSSVFIPRSYSASSPLLGLPQPGHMVNLSRAFNPVMVKGLTLHPENPLMFDFIVSVGQSGLEGSAFKDESQKLIKYFLACLTVPEQNWWVNLSPYEKDKIITDDLGQTDLGRDLLAQDYILKQITASLINPEHKIGKDFWDRVYQKTQAQFGTNQIPVNTFNKVWILADQADVLERNNTAFVVASHLKVMLEEDYLALSKNHSQPKLRQPGDMFQKEQQNVSPSTLPTSQPLQTKASQGNPPTHSLSSQIIKEIILPELELEVNSGKNFAQLRQMYHALILANWYKTRLKDALLNQVYSNQGKVVGIDIEDKDIKNKIYERYLQAYKKGVFNFIKEDQQLSPKSSSGELTHKTTPRKYFSGGVIPGKAASQAMNVRQVPIPSDFASLSDPNLNRVTFVLGQIDKMIALPNNKAMTSVDLSKIIDGFQEAVYDNQAQNLDTRTIEFSSHNQAYSLEIIKEMKNGKNLLSIVLSKGINRNKLEIARTVTFFIQDFNQSPIEFLQRLRTFFIVKEGNSKTHMSRKTAVVNFAMATDELIKVLHTPFLLQGDGYQASLEVFVSQEEGEIHFQKRNDGWESFQVISRKINSGQIKRAVDALARALHQKKLGESYFITTSSEPKLYGKNAYIMEISFKKKPSSRIDPNKAMIAIERLSSISIMEKFGLNETDAVYFSSLIAKYLSDRIIPNLGRNSIASALLNGEARQTTLKVTDAKEILYDERNLREAQEIYMRVMQLKGGLGTSFKRLATLKRLFDRHTLADKGTDSYFEGIPVNGFDLLGKEKIFDQNISVAELKLLYYIHLIQNKSFSEIEVQELVNDESKEAVEKFWDTIYLIDRVDDRVPSEKKRTYRQIFSNDSQGIIGLKMNPNFIIQGVLPVVDATTGKYLNDVPLRSPGGHAAFVSITADDNAKNKKDLSKPRISVFTNGDGVNNMLPPAIAGWMKRMKIPIAMIITTKQLLDLKGGLITLLSNSKLPNHIQEKLQRFETLSMEDIISFQNDVYPYLLEIAQAKMEGQQDTFQKMGIILGEKRAQFFNTNLHAQYHNILDPFLQELKEIVGDDKFYEIIGPDLIVNPKEKKIEGKDIKVILLEGASGSALLSMNRFVLTTTDPRVVDLKKKFGIERLVYFVNFDEELRSEVFTPEKFTWDHYLYGFTDLFKVDPMKGRLVFNPTQGRSTLPGFDLDKFYEDLENDINAFGRNLGVRELDYLGIRGEVHIPNAIVKGGVFIKNKSGKSIDLTNRTDLFTFENGRLILNNVFITINQNGKLTIKPVVNILESISDFEKVDSAMINSLTPEILKKTKSAGLDALMLLKDFSVVHEHGNEGDFGSFVLARIANTKVKAIRSGAVDLATPYGGIDFNPKNLGMTVTKEGEGVRIILDPAQVARLKKEGVVGFLPIIINIVPLTNIFPILGLETPMRRENNILAGV